MANEFQTIKASDLVELTEVTDSNYIVVTDGATSKKVKATILKGNSLTSEQTQQLSVAYAHSQSPHVNSEDLSNINSAVNLNNEKINELNSQINNLSKKINVNLSDYSSYVIDDDWSAALQKAIDDVFAKGGGIVDIPSGEFKVKDIVIKKNVTVRGQGYLSTTLKAIDSCIIKHDVNSILNGGNGDTSGWKLEGIRLHGADLRTDICLFRGNNAHITFKDVYFYATFGSALTCVEFFDIRFENCFFYWCGNEDGTKPVIELKNENGYEYNNNQYYYGCVFEGNRGKIINCKASNNTEFKFVNCKFENNESVTTQLDFENCGELSFTNTFIAGNGNNTTKTIPNLISFKKVSGIHGELTLYKWDRTVKSNITNLVLFDTCSKYDIDINIFRECVCEGNYVQINTPARDGSLVNVTGVNTQNTNRDKVSKQIFDFFGDIIMDSNGETLLKLKRDSNNSWDIGRLTKDGNDTIFKLIYNNSSGENKILECFGSNKLLRFYTSSLVLPKSTTDPSTQSGGIYFNTTTNKFRGYNGTTWVDLG